MSNINNQIDPKKALEKRKRFFRILRNIGALAGITALLGYIILSFVFANLESQIASQQKIIGVFVDAEKSEDEGYFTFTVAKRLIFEQEQGICIKSVSQLDGSAWNTKIVDEFIKTLDPAKVKVLRDYTGTYLMPFAHIISYYDNEKDCYEPTSTPKIMIVIPALNMLSNYHAMMVRNYKSLELFDPESVKEKEKENKYNITIVSISTLNSSRYGNGVITGIENAIPENSYHIYVQYGSWLVTKPDAMNEFESALNRIFNFRNCSGSALIAYTTDIYPEEILFMVLAPPGER